MYEVTKLLPPPRRDYYRLRMFEIAVMEFRNQYMECKERTIVAYADGAEGQVAECCFRA